MYNNKPKTIKKMVIGTYISIITLKVNGLNAPTKRHRLAEWIQKQDPYICCLQRTHFWGFPGGAVVRNLLANAGDTGSCPGPGRSHMPQSG